MRERTRLGWLLPLSLLCPVAILRAQPPAPASRDDLEAVLSGLVTDARAAGRIDAAAFVVVRADTVLCQRGFGVEDTATNEPVDPERSVFLAASISKLFVAVAAAQLVEAGKLDLSAPVTDFVASPDEMARAVDVEALLTHRSGIEERLLGSLLPAAGPQPDLADFFARHPPRFARPPGRAIRYSNIGMALAGRIVECASGLDFCAYVEGSIFAPLAMRHSSFRQPLPQPLADHLVREGRRVPPRLAPYPAGSLAASPADMARFLSALLGDGATADGRILSVASAHDMRQRRSGAHPEMPGVALGLFESFVNGRRALFHTGDRGHHSILWFLPDEHVGFYLVYQAHDGESSAFRERFTQTFADRLIGAVPWQLPAPLPGAVESAARYCGTYRFEAGAPHTIEALAVARQEIRITSEPDGGLVARLGVGGTSLRLVETTRGLCRAEDGAYLAFAADAEGRTVRIDVSGSVGDPFGVERIAVYERWPLHAAVLLTTMLLFVLRGLWSPLVALLRLLRRRPPPPRASGSCARAFHLGGWTGLLVIVSPLLLLAWLLSRPFPLTGVPWILPAGASLLLAIVLLALVQSALGVRACLQGDGPLWQRAWLALATLGTLASVPVLAYWNLLGYRY